MVLVTDICLKQDDEMTTSTTTTVSPPVTRPPGGCVTSDGRKIEEGDVVEKDDPCEHCYCMAGIISCMIDPCMGSGTIEGETDNCVALDPEPGECCPKEFKCSEWRSFDFSSESSVLHIFDSESSCVSNVTSTT